jgi:hypothetical protein
MDSLKFSTVYHANPLNAGSYQGADNNYDDDMCQIDDKDDFLDASSANSKSLLADDDIKVPSLFVILPMFHDLCLLNTWLNGSYNRWNRVSIRCANLWRMTGLATLTKL